MNTKNKQFWNNKYQCGEIGWDIGYVSSPLKAYFDQLTDKNIKILVPGAGNGYEVEYLYKQGFTQVYILDWSELAIKNFKERYPNIKDEFIICHDFFELDMKFDLIVEQTFFCALPPSSRNKYVEKMNKLLNKGGKLIGLLFNIPLNTDKPPYGGTKQEYETLFSPAFHFKILEPSYNSIPPRAESELFFIATKKAS